MSFLNNKWKKRLFYWLPWLLGSLLFNLCLAYEFMPLIPGTEIPIPVVLFLLCFPLPFYLDYRRATKGLKKDNSFPRAKFDLSKKRHFTLAIIAWVLINLGILVYCGITSPKPEYLEPKILILVCTTFFGGFLLILVLLELTRRKKVKRALGAGSGRPWISKLRTSLITEEGNEERGRILNDRLSQKADWQLNRSPREELLKLGLYLNLPNDLRQPLDQRILVFVESFEFTGVDLEVTDEMKMLVAAQACLLILKRQMSDYRHLRKITLYKNRIKDRPGFRGTASRNEVHLVWKYVQEEVKINRPTRLERRRGVRPTGLEDGRNLTLHEFAHVLDSAEDGTAQSIPVSEDSKDYEQWKAMRDEVYDRLEKVYENYSDAASGLWINHFRPEIRSYALHEYEGWRRAEMLTCATEAFFERGHYLRRQWPEVYALLKKFYRLDPACWH
ncbi:MAG TPA: hypothetical protein DCG39_04065 [Opitutae bacterium]|nr:hypothetical protein [Opitutae bacterium]